MICLNSGSSCGTQQAAPEQGSLAGALLAHVVMLMYRISSCTYFSLWLLVGQWLVHHSTAWRDARTAARRDVYCSATAASQTSCSVSHANEHQNVLYGFGCVGAVVGSRHAQLLSHSTSHAAASAARKVKPHAVVLHEEGGGEPMCMSAGSTHGGRPAEQLRMVTTL